MKVRVILDEKMRAMRVAPLGVACPSASGPMYELRVITSRKKMHGWWSYYQYMIQHARMHGGPTRIGSGELR